VVTTAAVIAKRERRALAYASAAPPTSNSRLPLGPFDGGVALIGSLVWHAAGG